MNRSKQRGFIGMTGKDFLIAIFVISLVGWGFWSLVFKLLGYINISFG